MWVWLTAAVTRQQFIILLITQVAALLTAKDYIAAATCQIRLEILTTRWISPVQQ